MALTKVTYTNNVTVIGADNLNDIQDEIIRLDADKADLDSPALTGTPTAPTPTEGDSSTKIATTAFVANLVGEAAQVDGSYPDMSAGGVISSTYTEDSDPYTYRKSPVGGVEVDEIVGGSVGWNQLVQLSDYPTRTMNGITYTNNGDGSITINGTATGTAYINHNYDFVQNHVYYIRICPSGGSASTYFGDTGAGIGRDYGNGLCKKYTGETGSKYLRMYVVEGVTVSNLKCYPQFTDLTLALGSTIADYVYSLETATAGAGVTWLKTHFPKMFGQYNAYDAGSIKSVEGVSAHKMVGKNLLPNTTYSDWTVKGSYLVLDNIYPSNTRVIMTLTDKDTSVNTDGIAFGFLIGGYEGTVLNSSQYRWIRNSNGSINSVRLNIPASGDTSIYLPSLVMYPTTEATYNAFFARYKVQIELGSTATDYEPYETWSYPLDSSLTLRGIPNLDSSNNLYYDGDTYASDGTVTRNTILRAYQSGDESLANAITDGTNTVVYSANVSTESATSYQNPQRVGSTEEYVTDSIVPVGHNSKYYDSFTVPKVPSTDGTYILKVTISGGFPTYTWEATE